MYGKEITTHTKEVSKRPRRNIPIFLYFLSPSHRCKRFQQFTYTSSLLQAQLTLPSTMVYPDPQNAAFAAMIHGQPEPHQLGYIDARASLETLNKCNVAPDITVEKLEVPRPDGTSTVVVIFRPENAPSKLPMVFYLHGGGWIMGRYGSSLSSLVESITDVLDAALRRLHR
jgi:acetyl esterase/lipase